MQRRLAYISLLVDDYDNALAFYTGALRFQVLEDTPLTSSKRWVVIAPGTPGDGGGALLLAKASTTQQQALIGHQGGGRVWLFLHTDDIDADIAHMQQHGVRFTEAPRDEAYGRVVVFLDLYGNRWDLVQPTPR